MLRYLALLLAPRAWGEAAALPGWPAADLSVPVLALLGKVAAGLQASVEPSTALLQVIGDILDDGVRPRLRDHLLPALLGDYARRAGDEKRAGAYFRQALDLVENAPVRRFLTEQAEASAAD